MGVGGSRCHLGLTHRRLAPGRLGRCRGVRRERCRPAWGEGPSVAGASPLGCERLAANPGVKGKATMGRRLAVAVRAARAVRGLWPDRNPLRRTIDRVEAVIMGGLAVAFLAAAPLIAVAAWHIAYSMGSRTVHAQQAAWHQVPAVPLTTVPISGYGPL